MNISDVLKYKYSQYKWSVGETYESLRWDSSNSIDKPTEQQINLDAVEYGDYVNSIANLKKLVNIYLWPWMDKKAYSKGYYNSAQCSALVTSTIASVRADAQAFNSWRDQVLLYINQVYRDVNNQVRTRPTIQELLDELPILEWP